MILSLLATFGTLGIAFGLFGLYLARTLLGGGSEEGASDARHNAHLLLITGATLLIVSLARAA
jgi:hypothetical protein